MLTVIAIIAILLSIMMPVISAAGERAKQSICMAHVQQIGYGEFMYAMDNKDYFPDSYALGGFPFRAAPGWKNPKDFNGYPEIYGLTAILNEYVNYDSNSNLWVCPGQPHDWMRKLGNTYSANTDGMSFTNVKDASETVIAGDNFTYLPYTPGVRALKVEKGFEIDESDILEPHSLTSEGGAMVIYADCHAAPRRDKELSEN